MLLEQDLAHQLHLLDSFDQVHSIQSLDELALSLVEYLAAVLVRAIRISGFPAAAAHQKLPGWPFKQFVDGEVARLGDGLEVDAVFLYARDHVVDVLHLDAVRSNVCLQLLVVLRFVRGAELVLDSGRLLAFFLARHAFGHEDFADGVLREVAHRVELNNHAEDPTQGPVQTSEHGQEPNRVEKIQVLGCLGYQQRFALVIERQSERDVGLLGLGAQLAVSRAQVHLPILVVHVFRSSEDDVVFLEFERYLLLVINILHVL